MFTNSVFKYEKIALSVERLFLGGRGNLGGYGAPVAVLGTGRELLMDEWG